MISWKRNNSRLIAVEESTHHKSEALIRNIELVEAPKRLSDELEHDTQRAGAMFRRNVASEKIHRRALDHILLPRH
jgi:hypothetical protein